MKPISGMIIAALTGSAVLTLAQLQVPRSVKHPVTDTMHGVKIVDSYRWLENQTSKATRAWIKSQNQYSDALLKNQPSRAYLKRRLTQLSKIEQVGAPSERHGRLFFSKQRPQDEQAILYYRDLDGKDRVFLDPNPLSKDHTTSASYVDFSDDGHFAAYQIRKGGVDETVIRIRNVDTGKDLADTLPLADYWSFALVGDMSGFYYCPHVNLVGVRVKYHKMGTPVVADQEIFGSGYNAEIGIQANVSEDRHWLLITVSKGWNKNEIYVQNLIENGPVQPVVTGFDASYAPMAANEILYLLTDKDAPRRRIIAYDLHVLSAKPRDIVPATVDTIESASLMGGSLLVQRLHNVSSQITSYSPEGVKREDVKLPGIGQALLSSGRWDSPYAYLTFDSFATPQRVYSLYIPTSKTTLWHETKIAKLDSSKLITKQIWAISKDGAKVPAFMVYRKGLKLDGQRPTLLTGYGGFNSSELPYFSKTAVLFAENGGVFVLANLRGGGEFGEAWHKDGMLGNKQHVFDDFVAIARWLIKNKVTHPSKLAISGGSNGGLLVGAALTQHPELFQAVLCQFPLLDMLRYDLFMQGPQWVPELGTARKADQFKWLRAYSPYQNVKPDVQYPAVLFDTGDGDTRVAPLHARKMTALLQASTSSLRPILLHYDTAAGHSGGESLSQEIERNSLDLAFLFWQLGIRPK